MGWKDVARTAGKDGSGYRGKRPDRAGRLRAAQVPRYSTDPGAAAAIEARMKQLGLWERYVAELSRLSRAGGLPSMWASPDQKARAALKTVGARRDGRKAAER